MGRLVSCSVFSGTNLNLMVAGVVNNLESVSALLMLVGLRFGVCKPEPQAVKNLQ